MEAAEMQKQDKAEKADPAFNQGLVRSNFSGGVPKQQQSKTCLQTCPKPFPILRGGRLPSRIEEGFPIHARPRCNVGQRTPRTVRNAVPSSPPRDPLESEKDRERQGPHEEPRRHAVAEENRACRKNQEQEPSRP